MRNGLRKRHARKSLTFVLALFILAGALPQRAARGQIAPALKSEDTLPKKPAGPSPFRIETLPVGSDAQLLTVFGSLDGLKADASAAAPGAEVPLVSILRDTLGDADPENDRLRYVWMLTYTRPTALAARRLGRPLPLRPRRREEEGEHEGRAAARHRPRRPEARRLAALHVAGAPERRLQPLRAGRQGFGLVRSGATPTTTARRTSCARSPFSRSTRPRPGASRPSRPSESAEIQARLMLTGKSFGGLIDDSYLDEVLRRQNTQQLDTRGHNWELLRQRAEAEGLYFEPLTMPDGNATHALL